MSILSIRCNTENTVILEVEKEVITQEDIDSYKNTKCNINSSHPIKVYVDEVEVQFSTYVPNYIPDVTPRQIRQALILSGISLAQIDAAFNSLSEPMKSLALAEWEYSISFQRHRPLVSDVAHVLGWTDQQVDALWLFAASL